MMQNNSGIYLVKVILLMRTGCFGMNRYPGMGVNSHSGLTGIFS